MRFLPPACGHRLPPASPGDVIWRGNLRASQAKAEELRCPRREQVMNYSRTQTNGSARDEALKRRRAVVREILGMGPDPVSEPETPAEKKMAEKPPARKRLTLRLAAMPVSGRPDRHLDPRRTESVVEGSREFLRRRPHPIALSIQLLDDRPTIRLKAARSTSMRPLAVLIHSCRHGGSVSGVSFERFRQSLRQCTWKTGTKWLRKASRVMPDRPGSP